MSKTSAIIKLCRPEQYYKNLVIFLAIIFSGNLLRIDMLFRVSIGFLVFCLISSACYIINDIKDRRLDKLSKDKLARPIASGRVSIFEAVLLAAGLFFISILIASYLNANFLIAVISFFAISQLYTFFLKSELFLDIIAIATNFVIRALAGGSVIDVWVSPWLITGIFFLALFLATGKRKSEKLFSGKNYAHRPVLAKYSGSLLDNLLQINTAILILAYALYCFLGPHQILLITLPIVLYAILRYLYLVNSGSEIARNTAKIFTDTRINLSLTIYLIITFIVLYHSKILVF